MILNDQCFYRNTNPLLVLWPLEIYKKEDDCFPPPFFAVLFVIVSFQIVPQVNVPFWYFTPPPPINEPSEL